MFAAESSVQWLRTAVCLAVFAWSVDVAQAQTKRTDYGGDGVTWEDGANWSPDGVPISTDDAFVNRTANGGSLSVSTTQAVDDLAVSNKSNSGTFVSGTSTLNVLPGATLTVGSTSGFRIGHERPLADGVGSSAGEVIQSGGTVLIPNGTNGLRMSQSHANAAESLYRISGGSLQAGAVGGTQTPLNLGGRSNNFGVAEFHVVGSGATSIVFGGDAVLAGSETASGGVVRLHFTLDAAGVTPIVLGDELRFDGTGTKQLVVDMIALPPQTDITLIRSNRITTGNSSTAQFTGLPDLSPISATFGPTTYHWLLDYTAGANNGVLDSSVVLRFQSAVTAAVPELSSFCLVGLIACGGAWARRRRTTAGRL
ncbi:MAG: hypothetical protein KF847_19520 [Pirellulales bacterium]|nr:hypothetical protein [Pirellulales bacterium]